MSHCCSPCFISFCFDRFFFLVFFSSEIAVKFARTTFLLASNHSIFFLDKKETKNQERTMLSSRKMAFPRPPFFRACAL